MTDERLLEMAIEARKNAYVPYSGYAVGAALETKDGHVFTGCNVESCLRQHALRRAHCAGEGGQRGYREFTKDCHRCRAVLRRIPAVHAVSRCMSSRPIWRSLSRGTGMLTACRWQSCSRMASGRRLWANKTG